MSETLIERLMTGKAFLDDIDGEVDLWHETGVGALWDFLGMTEEEYSLWVEQPDVLRFIVVARDCGEPLETVLERYQNRDLVAARADDEDAARAVAKWLRHTGRLT